MTKESILRLFKTLARSQGFYGRLLCDIGYDGENVDSKFWEKFKDCKSDIDVIMMIEG